MRLKARFYSASVLVALTAASPWLAPRSAFAKDPSASEQQVVKEMLKDAINEEKTGKCADAIAILKQAAAIKETAEVALHMGDCQAKMGHLRDALTSFERALDLARQAKDRGVQQAAPAKIEQLKGRIPTIALRMPSDVKGASVRVDEEQVAADRLGAPIQVDPGEHAVTVTADGRKPFSQKVSVAEKDNAEVTVELPLAGDASQPSTAGTAKHEDKPEPDTGKSRGIPLGTWIAGSAAIALTIGGIVAFVAAGSAASDGEEQCKTSATCDQGAIDSVHQLDTAALALWIGAGIGAGVAVAFYVLDKPHGRGHAPPPTNGRRNPPSNPPSARVVVAPGSVRVVGAF